jgi:hypothetical protein
VGTIRLAQPFRGGLEGFADPRFCGHALARLPHGKPAASTILELPSYDEKSDLRQKSPNRTAEDLNLRLGGVPFEFPTKPIVVNRSQSVREHPIARGLEGALERKHELRTADSRMLPTADAI